MKKLTITVLLAAFAPFTAAEDHSMRLWKLELDIQRVQAEIDNARYPHLAGRDAAEKAREAARAETRARIERIRADDAEGHARRQAAFDAAARAREQQGGSDEP